MGPLSELKVFPGGQYTLLLLARGGGGGLIGRALAWPGAGAKLGAFPSLLSGPSNFSKKVLIKKILSLQTVPCPFQAIFWRLGAG